MLKTLLLVGKGREALHATRSSYGGRGQDMTRYSKQQVLPAIDVALLRRNNQEKAAGNHGT
jgi:hypothetical protein